MNRRLQTLGAGIGLVTVLGIGAVAGHGVIAQSATPTPAATTTNSTTKADERAATYNEFIVALAANLGITDTAQVDAAIRDTLKQQVNAEFTAGHISQDQADAMIAQIDSSEAPLGGFGHIGGRRGDFDGGHHGRGGTAPGEGGKQAPDVDDIDGSATPAADLDVIY